MQDLELRVDDVAVGGDGIARADDGRIVFVRGGVPGDVVRAEVTEDKPRMLRADAVDVRTPSAHRVVPPCPHARAGCGGCGWQHVDVEGQRRGKQRMVEESLRRLGHVEGPIELGPVLPDAGFRTTLRCLVVDGRLAFRGSRSHLPVPVDSCMVAHPALDELVRDGRFGSATEAVLRIGGATGERLVVLDPSVTGDVRLPADVRVVGADELAAGRDVWFHDVVAGRRFRISARSFFQTRTDGAEALVAAVRAGGDGRWGAGRLADLYGGVGLFASTLGEGMAVSVVESSRSSAADAVVNLADRHATVVRSSVERWRPTPADLVVADPPRSGLGRAGVGAITATGADRLVLVSCDAAAFGRDAGLLAGAGYERRDTVLVDLFPHTPRVELVSRFDRVAT
ncbi:MAG TPA: TRAM domain-containing protein [Acidimicrobiales bacterium]|nr:TRAM domain-containing protein [Acidimicrobiales bacterium]